MATESTTVLEQIGHSLRRRSNRSSLLVVPLAIFELLFFILPLAILMRISLNEETARGAYAEGTWTVQSYLNILGSEYIHGLVIFTFKLALVTTLVTIPLALLYAYAIWRAEKTMKTLLLVGVVVPLLTTLVVKLYAWVVLLAPNGSINDLLLSINAIQEPVLMMNNFFGVVVGQVYVSLPYAILAIYSVITTMDWEIVEAARDLGASRPRSFVEVVVPQAIPGIAVAIIISFAWAVGSYTAPSLLGSSRERTFAIEVDNLMLKQFNWPKASALAIGILIIVLVTVIALFRFTNRSAEGFSDV